MLRSVPMLHMQVQVPGGDAPAVTHCIASEGLLHLVDIAHGRVPAGDSAGDCRASLAAFRELASRIRRTADRLGIALPELEGGADARAPASFEDERKTLETAFLPIEEAANAEWAMAADGRERVRRLETARAQAARMARAGVATARLAGLRFTVVRLGVLALDSLHEITAFASPAPVAVIPLDAEGARGLVAVAAPRSAAERVDAALRLVSFEPLEVSTAIAEGNEETLAAERDRSAADVKDADAALTATAERARSAVIDIWQRAQLAVVLLQAQTHFAVAGRFVVIAGWIPEERSEALAKRIAGVSAGRAIVTFERPEEMPEAVINALRIPILHRNPLLFRPFEGLVRLYGMPSYTEVEPTAFFAVSFLLMFGLMFGDVGHGATLFSAGYLLYRRVPRFLDYGILLMEVGVASAFFGALYGSVFGVQHLIPVLWMEPVRDLPRFMAYAIGLGVVLISLGLALSIVNSWRAGERPRAIFGLQGLFGAFLYWTLLALAVRAVMPTALHVPTWLIVALAACAGALIALKKPIVTRLERGRVKARNGAAGPAWLGALEGSVELVDALVTFFANTVSFVRVAAFAAVHAGILVAMFALADTLAGLRFGGILSAVALVAGNVIIILLEGLTVSVQVLRLEYYEFFGRFFRGGGEAYRPLMLRTKGES